MSKNKKTKTKNKTKTTTKQTTIKPKLKQLYYLFVCVLLFFLRLLQDELAYKANLLMSKNKKTKTKNKTKTTTKQTTIKPKLKQLYYLFVCVLLFFLRLLQDELAYKANLLMSKNKKTKTKNKTKTTTKQTTIKPKLKQRYNVRTKCRFNCGVILPM